MKIFHTGFKKIEHPDIHIGRRNADFGQGFYLSPNEAFSLRWARVRRGEDTWLNVYDLNLHGLDIQHFNRDAEWFDYIFSNRNGQADMLNADVVIGPIANDTLYDTWGLTTSGLLKREIATQLLTIGPIYEQVVIKTAKAESQLTFLSAFIISREEIEKTRATVQSEEAEYQKRFAAELEALMKD